MGIFDEEREREFDELRAKAFKEDPFLLYERFKKINEEILSMLPDSRNIPDYKAYLNTVTKYFSREGGSKNIEQDDETTLRDKHSDSIIYALKLCSPKNIEDGPRSKDLIAQFSLFSKCFNTIADQMLNDPDYVGFRSYDQYVKDRRVEAEQERERINAGPEKNLLYGQEAADAVEQEDEKNFNYCEAYSKMIISLNRELKNTNGFFTRDSKEYKNLAGMLERESLRMRVSVPSKEVVTQSLTELSALADAYIGHVPKNPDSRQTKRSNICNTIKAIAKLNEAGADNPRYELEKMFIKTLVYNEDPRAYMARDPKVLDRAANIYTNEAAKAEIQKLSIVKLVAPTSKEIKNVTKAYDTTKDKEAEGPALE